VRKNPLMKQIEDEEKGLDLKKKIMRFLFDINRRIYKNKKKIEEQGHRVKMLEKHQAEILKLLKELIDIEVGK